MPFTKDSARLAGGIGGKVSGQRKRDWNDIGTYILAVGSGKFVDALDELSETDKKVYVDAFIKTLEYFKPKLSRAEIEAKVTQKLLKIDDDK